jgi:hypothetical protein
MPDTVDHRVDMFHLAEARRRSGRPIWDHKLNLADVFHNEEMTFEERRDAIARRVRTSAWLRNRDNSDPLPYLIDELADTADAGEFDEVWDVIYDYADADRVWIATH